MSHRLNLLLWSWMLFVPVVSFAEEPAVKLKAGDRIVFLGDSITQGGAGPNGYVTMIRQALDKKHADLKIEVIGAGISGNKVPDLQRRLDKDVIARKPTIVFIYIGINDVWHGEKDPARGTLPDAFESGLKEVIGKCRDAGATVVLCTPSVIGDSTTAQTSSTPNWISIPTSAASSRKTFRCRCAICAKPSSST